MIKMFYVYNEDCIETLESGKLPLLDCVVTSPPYNIGLKYNQYKDNMMDIEYIEWLYSIFLLIDSSLKEDGHIFLNMDSYSKNPLLVFQVVIKLSEIFTLQNTIAWIKSISIDDITRGHFKPINSKRYLNHNHEYIFHFTKNGNTPIDRKSIGVPYMDKSNIKRRNHIEDKRCRGDTWFIPYKTIQNKEQKFNHPGTFPIELPLQCLKLVGKTTGNVYDPFMGTGTTLLASEQIGWNGYGSELSEDYVNIALKRLFEIV